MGSESQVRVLRTVPEIEEIRSAWASWPGNRDSDIDFYLEILRLGPKTSRPHVILVSREGRPDAMLVGRIERGRLGFRMAIPHFKPRAVTLYFVQGARRGNPSLENDELLVNEICRSLSRGEADVAYLNLLRTDSHIYRLARTIPGFLSRDRMRASQSHFSMVIPRTVEEFYRGLSPKVRSQQKSKQRKLVNDFSGAVKIRCFREPPEIDTMVQDVELVAKKSYQRGLGVGFIDSPEARERLRLKAQRGWLRAYVLYVSERPCAYWIGDINQGIFGSDYLGHDSDLGKYSPGMYLIMKVIEGFCNDNDEVNEVDFAPGRSQYKEVLANREWHEAPVYIFAPSLKGVELNLVRFFTTGIAQVVKRTLGRTRLLQRIKKTWRAHARREQTKETQPS